MRSSVYRRQLQGFTLLELLIVILILAVLAGTVIPRLVDSSRPARFAAAADSIGELSKNLQNHQQFKGSAPDRFDSLQSAAGTAYSKLRTHVLGGKARLILETFEDDATLGVKWLSSLKKGGIKNVMLHDEAPDVEPNSSGKILLEVTGTVPLPTLNGASADAASIIGAIYPEAFDATGAFVGFPTGVRPVVLGVGPANTAIGSTMIGAPRAYDEDTDNYDRFLVVYSVFADGRPARLRTVLEPHCESLDQMLTKYTLEAKVD